MKAFCLLDVKCQVKDHEIENSVLMSRWFWNYSGVYRQKLSCILLCCTWKPCWLQGLFKKSKLY